MSGVGLFLTLLVEVVVQQGDISRMNTVFKFYVQVWILLGISAAVCITWIIHSRIGWRVWTSILTVLAALVLAALYPTLTTRTKILFGISATACITWIIYSRTSWRIWTSILAMLVALAALYPILATRAKINDRWTREIGPGLDSLEWMTVVNDVQYGPGAPDGLSFPLLWDYQALMWLRENIHGSPVVAEGAQAPPYRSLRGRVATYTGLPIIIGYPWHQKQQRSFLTVDLIGQRERDVNQLYSTPDPWSAKEILDRYDVSLVYLGDLERASYDPAGIEKFANMVKIGLLRPVYTNKGVTIYEVVR
jgi:uncharacterized membrane protein